MTPRDLTISALLLVAALACDGSPGDTPAPAPAPAPAPTPAEPAPAKPAPAVAPAPEPAVAPAPEPAPTSSFDPKLAKEAVVRVVTVHRDHWVPCGRSHSTGVIEVEVLEVGEPAPRMLLVISCPVDFGHRQLLVVGKTLKVGLFAKRQPWPVPPALRELPADLPRRWVKSMVEIDGVPPV